MRALLTGCAGFVGSHFVEYYLEKTNWDLICLVRMSRAGDMARLERIRLANPDFDKRVTIVRHDLNDPLDIIHRHIGEVDYIVHLAADSHVDYSIQYPVEVFLNNARSTVNLLDYARRFQPNLKKFVMFSTDEVFGASDKDAFHENSELNPSSSYSAGKAAAEQITIAFHKMYGTPYIITRCMNIFGETQDPEKFIPRATKLTLGGWPVTVHGNEEYIGTRFWIYAKNVADAILTLIQDKNILNVKVNIPGNIELNNLEMAQKIAEILQIPLNYQLVEPENARPGYDRSYHIVGKVLKDWIPPFDFEESLEQTVLWTKDNLVWLK